MHDLTTRQLTEEIMMNTSTKLVIAAFIGINATLILYILPSTQPPAVAHTPDAPTSTPNAEATPIAKETERHPSWGFSYYVDDFGEPTKKFYGHNKNRIAGTFSNSAGEGLPLGVEFLVNSAFDISIQLYEYNRNNPVKADSSSPRYFKVLVRDEAKQDFEMEGINYGNRISLKFEDSNILHKILVAGGVIKFKISEKERNPSVYTFIIENTDGYKDLFETKNKE